MQWKERDTMNNKDLHPYLKERLEKEEQFFAGKGIGQKRKKVLQSIREGKFLKETIVREVYPEWKKLIAEAEPTYYRIDVSQRKADAYSDYNKAPLLVALPPNRLEDEDAFAVYFGMDCNLFVKKIKDGLIIPQILWPTEYRQMTHFCKQFFNRWLEDEKLHEQTPLLFANRIQKLFGGELSASGWVDKYRQKFKAVKNEEVEVPGLGKKRAIEHLCERYGFFTLFWEDGARILQGLSERYTRSKEGGLLQVMSDFAFAGHQHRTAHILYCKGSVVTASAGDLKIAIKNFAKVVDILGHRVSPEVMFLVVWISEVKQKIERLPEFVIARIKDLKDRERYYDMRREDDKVQMPLRDATHCGKKIAHITRNEKLPDKLEEIAYLVAELSKNLEKVTLASKNIRHVDTVVEEFVPTLVVQGVQQALRLPLLPREIERIPEQILKEIIHNGKESMYLRLAKGGKVPLSVWKEGERDVFTLEGMA